MKPIDLGLIQARRKKIEAEIQDKLVQYQKAVAVLEDELQELKVAERVFSKLTQGSAPDKKGSSKDHPASGKPADLPAVSQMIKDALQHAVMAGGRGMKPAALLSYIRGTYWNGAQSKDVGSIAWRMWKNGQLEKSTSGVYALLKPERDAIREAIAKEAAKMPPPSGQLQLNP
jgi:hypothetical protein